MSKDPTSDALEIAREIENHLKFYREIGFEDIGGSLPGIELAPAANPEVIRHPSPPGVTSGVEQTGLFGDAMVSSKRGNTTPRGPLLPVLESPRLRSKRSAKISATALAAGCTNSAKRLCSAKEIRKQGSCS